MACHDKEAGLIPGTGGTLRLFPFSSNISSKNREWTLVYKLRSARHVNLLFGSSKIELDFYQKPSLHSGRNLM